jgi:hypothetical protein
MLQAATPRPLWKVKRVDEVFLRSRALQQTAAGSINSYMATVIPLLFSIGLHLLHLLAISLTNFGCLGDQLSHRPPGTLKRADLSEFQPWERLI